MPESDFIDFKPNSADIESEEFYLKNIMIEGNRYRMWWCIFLKKYPSYGEFCPVWDLFSPEDWLSLLWEQPSFAEKCKCWNSMQLERVLLLLKKHPELKPLAEKSLIGVLGEDEKK